MYLLHMYIYLVSWLCCLYLLTLWTLIQGSHLEVGWSLFQELLKWIEGGVYHPTYALAQVFICWYEGSFLHFCKIISQTICLHSFNGYAHFECEEIIIQKCFSGPLKSAGSVKDWLEYYVWRGLPLDSPVSLILHWVNGILSCSYVLMNEGLGFWNDFSRSLNHKLPEAESSCKTNFLKCCNNIMIIKV